MVVTLAPQVYVPLWASLTCFSSNDMLYSLTVLLKVLFPRAFCKCVVFLSCPLKSQNVKTSSASVSITSQWRVIVLPSSKVMFCCVVVTLSTRRRKRKINLKRTKSLPENLGWKEGAVLVGYNVSLKFKYSGYVTNTVISAYFSRSLKFRKKKKTVKRLDFLTKCHLGSCFIKFVVRVDRYKQPKGWPWNLPQRQTSTRKTKETIYIQKRKAYWSLHWNRNGALRRPLKKKKKNLTLSFNCKSMIDSSVHLKWPSLSPSAKYAEHDVFNDIFFVKHL